MPEALRITIKYDGPDVKDGTMPIGDVLDALHGFANGYGKIVSELDSERQHHLRLAAIEPGSFELIVIAWALATQGADTLHTVQIITESARWVISKITGVIAAKKHTKGHPYNVTVKGDNNTVVVVNAEGAELSLPPDTFNIFESRLIDPDLNKIASPLRPQQVETAEIRAEQDGEIIEESISAEERAYFAPPEAAVTTRETEIIGRLISLNKENNRGIFRLGNGKGVRYRYAGNNSQEFHVDFSYQGTVRVRCVATFNENLEPTHLDIFSVEHLQQRLPLPSG